LKNVCLLKWDLQQDSLKYSRRTMHGLIQWFKFLPEFLSLSVLPVSWADNALFTGRDDRAIACVISKSSTSKPIEEKYI